MKFGVSHVLYLPREPLEQVTTVCAWLGDRPQIIAAPAAHPIACIVIAANIRKVRTDASGAGAPALLTYKYRKNIQNRKRWGRKHSNAPVHTPALSKALVE